MNLILFYDNGHTVKFHDVSNFKLFDDKAEFNYFDSQSIVHRFGCFKNFIGFATEYDSLSGRNVGDKQDRTITLDELKSQNYITIDGKQEPPMFYCGNCGAKASKIIHLDYHNSDYFQITCDQCLNSAVESTVDKTINKFEKPVDK